MSNFSLNEHSPQPQPTPPGTSPPDVSRFTELAKTLQQVAQTLLNFVPNPPQDASDENEPDSNPLDPFSQRQASKEHRFLARQLNRGLKLLTSWDRDNYIQGEPRD